MKSIMYFIIILLPAILFSETITQNGLQVTVYDDYRSAPVAIPLYYTFELRNVSQDNLIIPLGKYQEFNIIVTNCNGPVPHIGGPIIDTYGGENVLKLAPGETYLYSYHLNSKFGFKMFSEGKYKVSLKIESDGIYNTAEIINGQMIPRKATCWKGTISTSEIEITITSPSTLEDQEIYRLLSSNGPIPDIHSYLNNKEALCGAYIETMYAGLALVDGYVCRSEKYPNEIALAPVIRKKYENSPIAIILEYHYGGFIPATEYEKKIIEYQAFCEKHKNTAWAAKAQKRISRIEECRKDKNSDKCKYPKNPV